jgi:ABC-type lipoprotein export system ATPase subunit
MSVILRAEAITKSYVGPTQTQIVLKDVNLSLEEGCVYGIIGPSGSGKSTLLYILSALEEPSEGTIYLCDEPYPEFTRKNDGLLSKLRRENFAFIFQFNNLIPTLTVRDNICLPLLLTGTYADKAPLVEDIIVRVGLAGNENQEIRKLSGGEQQRVSIARALLSDAKILFADEPTGNLDQKNSELITRILIDFSHEHNKAVVMVTHDMEMAARTDIQFKLRDGVLEM